MLHAGTLQAMKVGHLWRICAADSDSFINEKSEAVAAKYAAGAAVRTSTDGMG